jgi:hypothetical protein
MSHSLADGLQICERNSRWTVMTEQVEPPALSYSLLIVHSNIDELNNMMPTCCINLYTALYVWIFLHTGICKRRSPPRTASVLQLIQMPAPLSLDRQPFSLTLLIAESLNRTRQSWKVVQKSVKIIMPFVHLNICAGMRAWACLRWVQGSPEIPWFWPSLSDHCSDNQN